MSFISDIRDIYNTSPEGFYLLIGACLLIASAPAVIYLVTVISYKKAKRKPPKPIWLIVIYGVLGLFIVFNVVSDAVQSKKDSNSIASNDNHSEQHEYMLETTVQTTMQTVQTTVITTTEQITETTTAPMDPEKAFKKWLRTTLYEGGYDDVAVKSLSGYELITIYDELQRGFDEATKFDIAGYPALADKTERDTIKEVAEKHGITEDLARDIYSFMLYNYKDVKKHLNEMENKLRKQQTE